MNKDSQNKKWELNKLYKNLFHGHCFFFIYKENSERRWVQLTDRNKIFLRTFCFFCETRHLFQNMKSDFSARNIFPLLTKSSWEPQLREWLPPPVNPSHLFQSLRLFPAPHLSLNVLKALVRWCISMFKGTFFVTVWPTMEQNATRNTHLTGINHKISTQSTLNGPNYLQTASEILD